MKNLEIYQFSSDVEIANAAARDWLNLVPIAPSGMHLVALSGGRIASRFYDAVTEHVVAANVSFQHVHFFWSDERCVPPEHRESNFRLANKELLGPLGISHDKIHRIKGEIKPAQAVADANVEINLIAPPNGAGLPVLDLVLLGMGEDGHTASIFPKAPATVLESQYPFVATRSSSKPPPERISMSLAAIASARQVWVLISGPGKEKALRDSLDAGGKTPLAKMLQLRRRTRIYTDVPMDPATT